MNILLVDDHPIVLDGIKALVASRYDDARIYGAQQMGEAKRLLASHEMDVIVTDLELQHERGLDLVRYARQVHPHILVIIYTMHEEPWTIKDIVDANPDGVVMKSDDTHELLSALEAVMAGKGYHSTTFVQKWAGSGDAPCRLSERELQVLKLTADGLSISDTAASLHVTPSTVEFHRGGIMRKLKVSNVAEMVRKAMDLGWNLLRH